MDAVARAIKTNGTILLRVCGSSKELRATREIHRQHLRQKGVTRILLAPRRCHDFVIPRERRGPVVLRLYELQEPRVHTPAQQVIDAMIAALRRR